MSHISVLLHETVDALVADRTTGIYVDGTFGRGGHTRLLLSKLDENARVYAFDKDPQALAVAAELEQEDARFQIIHASFADLKQELQARGIESVDGVMADLGVSSPQLDQAERGFSFMKDGPLDMRMDPTSGISAATWVATSDFATMASVFREFGEERFAGKIAGHIIKCRELAPIETTHQLADIISEAVPFKDKHKHPATRVFQAIRIAVNEELTELSQTLNAAYDLLNPGGRLVVISFHSLEDRIVKNFMNHHAKPKDLLPDLPVAQFVSEPTLKLIGKPVKASDEESRHNPRARSAIMRIAEKLP